MQVEKLQSNNIPLIRGKPAVFSFSWTSQSVSVRPAFLRASLCSTSPANCPVSIDQTGDEAEFCTAWFHLSVLFFSPVFCITTLDRVLCSCEEPWVSTSRWFVCKGVCQLSPWQKCDSSISICPQTPKLVCSFFLDFWVKSLSTGSSLPPTMLKWCWNICYMGAAILYRWCYLKPESKQ